MAWSRRLLTMEARKMGRETDNWPFIKAKWFGEVPATSPRVVRHIVWHDMEYAEKLTAAEDVARYFATITEKNPDGSWVKKSAHICVDADSIVQCVRDSHIAYAAPGANSTGIQIELAGYARQTRAQWLDDYSRQMLLLACKAAAQYCVKYDLPPIHLTDQQLADGWKGMVGHDQVSRVFHKSDHTDPGPQFPWDFVQEQIGPLYLARLYGND